MTSTFPLALLCASVLSGALHSNPHSARPRASLLLPPRAPGEPEVAVQTEESVLVTYDLRTVMPRWDASTAWSQSLLVPPAANPGQSLPSVDDALTYGDLASFDLLDLLTQVLGDELREERGRELMFEGHVLTVLAPESMHEQVRSILEGLAMALSGTIPVRVDLLTLGEEGELPPAGPMADAEAGKLVSTLVARGARHQSYQLELSAGRTARADAFRRVPFLFDYDVEIAAGSVVFAPVMADTREGVRLILRGLPMAGGLSLGIVLLRSELLGEIQKLPLTLRGRINLGDKSGSEVVTGPDGIQSPEVLVRSLAFDTFLADGKALVLTLESALGGARTREVVLVRRLGGGMSSYVARPIPGTNRTLIALNAELFRAPRLRADATPWADAAGVLQPSVVAHFDGEISGFLVEWMKRFTVIRRFGPWILIVTDPTWDRDAAAQLDRLVKSLRPSTTLHDVTVELRDQGREGSSPVRLRVPVLGGTTAGFVVARGRTAVTSYGVEVAQGASVPDPFVSSICEGLGLALLVEGTTCEASGMAQLFDSAPATLDPGYTAFGPIQRPEPRLLRFDERLTLPEGRAGPVRIGSASERPEEPGLTLEITVTAAAR